MSHVAKRAQGPWAPVCVGAPPRTRTQSRLPPLSRFPDPKAPRFQPPAVVYTLVGPDPLGFRPSPSASYPAPAPVSRTACLALIRGSSGDILI